MRTLGGDWTEPTGRSCPAAKCDSGRRRAKVAHCKGKPRSHARSISSSWQPDANTPFVGTTFRRVIATLFPAPKTDICGFPLRDVHSGTTGDVDTFWRMLGPDGQVANRRFLEEDLAFPIFSSGALASGLLWFRGGRLPQTRQALGEYPWGDRAGQSGGVRQKVEQRRRLTTNSQPVTKFPLGL